MFTRDLILELKCWFLCRPGLECSLFVKPHSGPSGELLEELRERPQAVSVRLLDSSIAAVSWAPSSENHNGSLVSVVSTTCLRPSLSQRMENAFCSEVLSTHSRFLIGQHQ